MNIVTTSENNATLNNDELCNMLTSYALEVMSDFENETGISLDKPRNATDVFIEMCIAAELSSNPDVTKELQKKYENLYEDLRRNLNCFIYDEIKPIH
jgi:hypothetical protein